MAQIGKYTPTLESIAAEFHLVSPDDFPQQRDHIQNGRTVRLTLCPGKAAWLTPEDADEVARRLMVAAAEARKGIAERDRLAAEEEKRKQDEINYPYYV